MKIIKVQSFENTDFEAEAKKCTVTRVDDNGSNWLKVFYRIPKGRKEYAMFLKKGDVA